MSLGEVIAMSSGQPADFYEYSDSELSMGLPSYLRPKKGIRFFSARSKRDRDRQLLNVAVEIPTEDRASTFWSTIMNAMPSDWMGVRQRIVRRGKASYLTDGLELLHSSHNIASGKILYDYHVLFLLGQSRIYVTLFGQGEIQAFEDQCRLVVTSIRVKGSAVAAPK